MFPDERRTFAEVADRARTLARGLIGLGIEPGDRVGILMANSPVAAAGLFGVALAGAVAVLVNTRYRTVELPFVVGDAQLRTIITSDRIDDYVDLIGLLESALPGLRGAVRPEDLRPRRCCAL